MKITWINPAPIVAEKGQKTSIRACVRLRSMIPGDQLARKGHDVSQVALSELNAAAADRRFFRRDIFVIGKAFADISPVIEKIRAAGRARIFVDICDNVFAPPEDGLKGVYRAILPYADAVVTSSDALVEALANNVPVGIPIYSIADAVEEKRQRPVFCPDAGTVRLLWYGYPNNLPLLHGELKNLQQLAPKLSIQLVIVTAWPSGTAAGFPDTVGSINMRRVNWSPQAMRDELRACDIVIVPSDESPARMTKSANRVITGLWAGKYVVASPLPSYEPFREFASIGRDLAAGIQWAIDNPVLVPDRIRLGQDFILRNYSPRMIADAWEAAFSDLTKSSG